MLADSLDKLSHYNDSAWDALWPFFYILDPAEIRADREKQKMQLARYARQDLHKWDNIEVNEITRWCRRLKEVIDDEGPVQRLQEER